LILSENDKNIVVLAEFLKPTDSAFSHV